MAKQKPVVELGDREMDLIESALAAAEIFRGRNEAAEIHRLRERLASLPGGFIYTLVSDE